jgi:hypothetical protein
VNKTADCRTDVSTDSPEKVDRQPNFGGALLATPWESPATPLHALINAPLTLALTLTLALISDCWSGENQQINVYVVNFLGDCRDNLKAKADPNFQQLSMLRLKKSIVESRSAPEANSVPSESQTWEDDGIELANAAYGSRFANSEFSNPQIPDLRY